MGNYQKPPWEKIKQEYLSQEAPNLRELAEKYGITYGSLRNRKCREQWGEDREDRQEALASVRIEQTCRHDRLARISLELVETAYQELKLIFQERQESDVRFRTNEIFNVTKSLQILQQITAAANGEVSEAIEVLIRNGVVPNDRLPQIGAALEESQQYLAAALEKSFNGRVPD